MVQRWKMTAKGFGNYHHYNGDSIAEMIEGMELSQQNKYHRLIHALVELIGRKAVDEWADKTELDSMTTAEAIREVEYKLDQFECYCTPVNDPCGGCVRLAQA